MKDLKYIKTFEQYRMINEEEEGFKEWLLAGLVSVSSIFGGPKAMAGKVDASGTEPKTEIGQETRKNVVKIKVLRGTTDEERCYNETLQKFGLKTESGSRIYKGKVSDILKSIQASDSTIILDNFKPVEESDVKLSNFGKLDDLFMIGGEKIINEGQLSFDMTNPNQEIIASGNGLLALTRIARQGFGNKEVVKYARVEFKVPRESKSLKLEFSYDKEGTFKKMFFAFETAITESSMYKGENTYAHHTLVDKLIGATEEQSVEFIYGNMISAVSDFIPAEFYGKDVKNIEKYLTDNGYNIIQKEYILGKLKEFKEAGKVTPSGIIEINQKIKDTYLDNIEKFTKEYLGDSGSELVTKVVESNMPNPKNWKTFISGGEDGQTIARSWNSLKDIELIYKSPVRNSEEEAKTYRIGESKRNRKF